MAVRASYGRVCLLGRGVALRGRQKEVTNSSPVGGDDDALAVLEEQSDVAPSIGVRHQFHVLEADDAMIVHVLVHRLVHGLL